MSHLIYGIHPVHEALKSNLPIQKIYVGTEKPSLPLRTLIDQAREKGIPLTFTTRESLNKMSREGLHQNIVAIIETFQYVDLENILSIWKEEKSKALILILDGIQDPQNLGALIRTALGCGAHGVIIPKDRAVGITPTVFKASAGAVAHIPITRVVNLSNTINRLKKEGIWVYGASGEANDLIYNLDLTLDLAIVIGAEGKGIRPLVKKNCDRLFSIPMKGPVSSFNASVSAGMILYEVMRQRFLLMENS
ncbi:MAG: 23S rRNA (guanosine(2251)-2'-O)-methyltransferase RlmB [Thermodesulfobacteriota bacterium]